MSNRSVVEKRRLAPNFTVSAFHPRQIVDEVVRRNHPAVSARDRIERVQKSKAHVVRVELSVARRVEAREPITKAVDEPRAHDGVVPDRDTLVFYRANPRRRTTRELGYLVDRIVLRVDAHEQVLRAAVAQLHVEFEHVRLEIVLDRGGESVVHQVHAVGARIIRQRILFMSCEAALLGPMPRGSSALDIGWRQAAIAARDVVAAGESGDAAGGTLPRHRALINEHAVAIRGRRYGTNNGALAMLAQRFDVAEEEHAVLLDGAADRAAINVLVQFRRFAREALTELRQLQEVLVARRGRAASEFVSSAREPVSAALGDQRDLRAARTPHLRTVVARPELEFLQRVGGHAQHRRERALCLRVVDVDAVERYRLLVRARAVGGTIARVIDTPVRYEYGARLQAEELDDVERFDREIADLLFTDWIAEARVHCVENRRLRDHADRFGKLSDLELHVLTRRRVDAQLDLLEPRHLESGQFNLEVVDARRERRHLIQARFVGDHHTCRPCPQVRRGDRCSGHDAPLSVNDAARNRRRAGLGIKAAGEEQPEDNHNRDRDPPRRKPHAPPP